MIRGAIGLEPCSISCDGWLPAALSHGSSVPDALRHRMEPRLGLSRNPIPQGQCTWYYLELAGSSQPHKLRWTMFESPARWMVLPSATGTPFTVMLTAIFCETGVGVEMGLGPVGSLLPPQAATNGRNATNSNSTNRFFCHFLFSWPCRCESYGSQRPPRRSSGLWSSAFLGALLSIAFFGSGLARWFVSARIV